MVTLFLKELRHRWVIHLLAVALLACIVSILVVQSSINKSAEEKINELSHNLGKSMLVVPKGTDLEQFYSMKYGNEVMPDDMDQKIKNSPLGEHVTMVEPRLYGNISVKGTNLILVGHKTETSSAPGNVDSAVVGGAAAQRLGLSRGDSLDVGDTTLNVSKILNPSPKGFDMALFVPLRTAQKILNRPGEINALYMGGCWCEMDVATFASQVENTLPGTMAITVEGMAKAQTEINATMKRYTVVIWAVGAVLGIGTIAFLILYLVYKGGRDIGLLLSIGLSPQVIAAKNTVVGVLTALLGAILGYLLSFPIMTWLGKAFLRIGLTPSWDYLAQFAVGSALAGLFTALVLSLYLTTLDPTTLLREE
jgi:ABC-type antimicrobial peptide transport system permease subunit